MPANIEIRFDGPAAAVWTVALAHGAGAGMDTPFMEHFAGSLAGLGFRVARFEFAYMAQRRRSGGKLPPDREPALRSAWLEVVAMLAARRLIVGGKSMGGRIASLIADEAGAAGLVCLGYPFHPTGQPARLRIAHLQSLKTPALIVQGTRDPFGNQDEVRGYAVSPTVQVHWLEDGDHDFKPRRSSGRTQDDHWLEAVQAIERFIQGL